MSFVGNLGGGDTCLICEKRVYEMEKLLGDKGTYHKSCFRCLHCKRTLTLKNFASMDGRLYCKPHFMELFKTKGNYDEGFGKERKTQSSTPIIPADQQEPVEATE